jgi:glycosyltransferase involved in cell wall biosynthesis
MTSYPNAEYLLHQPYFDCTPVVGQQYRQLLAARCGEVAAATVGMSDPNVSIVIRARNEREHLERLLCGVNAQLFGGEVQTIVVDSGSSDGTKETAREYGAEIVGINQTEYSHPKALNLGFEAADHPYVMTLVAHATLTNRLALRGVTRWARDEEFAGAYGAALPDSRASVWERGVAIGQRLSRRLGPAGPINEWQPGAMVTHRSVLAKTAWTAMRGYDLAYGSGGEDTDMARRLLAVGMHIVREPVLSIFHSHALNLVGTVRQSLEYRRLRTGNPRPFNQDSLGYRTDLDLGSNQVI